MVTRVPVLVGLVFLSGCPRPGVPARAGSAADGTACTGDETCASGLCVDGVCCGAACAAGQRCDLPRSPGRCASVEPGDACTQDNQCPSGACRGGACCRFPCTTGNPATTTCASERGPGACLERVLGDACAVDDNCPSGACVGGTCCDGRCGGTCERCDLPGATGRCTLVPDNTQHGACAEPCRACFGGLCLPAVPGTNPGGHCQAGQACTSTGECLVAPGSACDVDAGASCAAGFCVAGTCMRVEPQVVTVPASLPSAQEHLVTHVAVSSRGQVSLLVRETEYDPLSATTVLAQATAYTRLDDGVFASRNLFPNASGLQAAMDMVGSWSLVAFSRDVRDRPAGAAAVAECRLASVGLGLNVCGLSATWVGPGAALGGHELVDDFSVPRAEGGPLPRVCALNLSATQDGDMLLAAGVTEESCHASSTRLAVWTYRRTMADGTWRRFPEGTWTHDTAALHRVGTLRGDVAVVDGVLAPAGGQQTVRVSWREGATTRSDTLDLALPCGGDLGRVRGVLFGSDGMRLAMGGSCRERPLTVLYDATKDGADRWTWDTTLPAAALRAEVRPVGIHREVPLYALMMDRFAFLGSGVGPLDTTTAQVLLATPGARDVLENGRTAARDGAMVLTATLGRSYRFGPADDPSSNQDVTLPSTMYLVTLTP